MTDLTPEQMREALDAALANYTPGIDRAVRFVTIDQVDMLAEFYLHNRTMPVAEPLCTWPSCGHTAKGQCRTYTSGQLIAPNDASITATNMPVAKPEPQAARVKPLVWVFHDQTGDYKSVYISGGWTISHRGDGCFALHHRDFNEGVDRAYQTPEAAQAAAQADYEARILAALDVSETPESERQTDLLSESERQAIRDKALDDAAQCCEAEADKCDDAVKWGGQRRYIQDCKAAAYAMRDRAYAIRVMKGTKA